ncbi:hypothetical protein EDD85DRAFT_964164 [Armillaria nabsnona]|nr:hypothetical protein EDD85DRAFT_964164 [Armillaria nabsnona]
MTMTMMRPSVTRNFERPFAHIIWWMEDGIKPKHTLLPINSSRKVVLEEHRVHLEFLENKSSLGGLESNREQMVTDSTLRHFIVQNPWAKDTWHFDELPLDKTGHPKEKKRLTEWRSAVTDTVLKHTSFKCFIDDNDWDLNHKKQAHREYSKVVTKFFKNYKNHALDKTSAKPTPSSQTRVKTDHASEHSKNFSGLVSGQKIFKESNATAIQMHAAELLSTGAMKNDNRGGANHKAISQLWNKRSDANHDQYDELALYTKNDRLMLQKELPGLFLDLLKETEELLGPVGFTLCYAFRDEVDGIDSGILNVCTDGIEKLSDAFSENAQDSLMAWAEVHIPHTSSTNFVVNTAKLHIGQSRNELSNHFHKNSEGVPHFPPVDLDNTTPLQLKVLVDEFFFTLWAYVQGQESEVPYVELIKSPGGFYDMSKWQSMPLLTCTGVDDLFVFWKGRLPPPLPPPAWSPTPLIATRSPSPPPLPAQSPTPPIPTRSPSPPP